jgi:hypothetical protein
MYETINGAKAGRSLVQEHINSLDGKSRANLTKHLLDLTITAAAIHRAIVDNGVQISVTSVRVFRSELRIKAAKAGA